MLIAEHPTLIEAHEHITRVNTPTVTKLKKTCSYYYTCTYVSPGCTKEWRIRTSMYPEVVYEDNSRGEHILHDHFERNAGKGLLGNAGRGLLDEQVNVFKEALITGVYQLMMSRILKYNVIVLRSLTSLIGTFL